MPVTVEWLEENRITLATLTGELTTDELLEINTRQYDLIVNQTRRIHLIADVRELKKFPTQLSSFQRSTTSYLKLDTMGWVFIVGNNNPIFRFLASIVTQVSSIDMRQVDTIEEAIQHLNHIDGIE